MALVAALTSEHGVSNAGPDGKTVWFTMRGHAAERSEQDLLAAWDDADWDDAVWDGAAGDEPGDAGGGDEPVAAPGGTGDVRPRVGAGDDARPQAARGQGPGGLAVVLLGLPPALWLAAREHHDALLRELVLYLAEHDGREQDGPVLDLSAVDRARAGLLTAVDVALQRAGAYRAGGSGRRQHPGGRPVLPAAIDVTLTVPAGQAGAFSSLQDVLDLAEGLAAAGQLLARPGLPEIVAVRVWACGQVLAQQGGGPAVPWAGADQGQVIAVVGVGRSADRRVEQVRDSDRRVASADDANRIVAVSRPLAELLGWEPAELVGRRIVALVPARLREQHVAGFTQHVVTGQGRLLGAPLILPVLRSDGTEIACRVVLEHDAAASSSLYRAWIDPVPAEDS